MITGNIKNISAYKGINPRLDSAIDYLLAFNPDTPDGKYEIDGKNLYVSIVSTATKSVESFEYEAHKNYIDLQYVIEGSEIMGYADVKNCTPITEYNVEKDVYMLKGSGSLIKVDKGDFYIVHPFDAHAPTRGESSAPIRKAVIKIKL